MICYDFSNDGYMVQLLFNISNSSGLSSLNFHFDCGDEVWLWSCDCVPQSYKSKVNSKIDN